MGKMDVTHFAKSIFGDIVESAIAGCYGKDTEIDPTSFEMGLMDTDGIFIIVKFTNGRKVLFESSEWGSITSEPDMIKDRVEGTER